MSKPYVVIVDDAAKVERLRAALADSYELLCLTKVSDALFHLQEEEVDVLVVSDELEDGKGAALLAQAADMAPLTCRILMSAEVEASFLLQAINVAKVTHFLKTPVDSDSLRQAIGDALQARGRSREALTSILLAQKSREERDRGSNEDDRTRPQGWPDALVEDLPASDTQRLAWFLDPDLHIGIALLSPDDPSVDVRSWSAELELRLVTSLRETDHCFRVGGRSFLVLFGHTSSRGCRSAGRRFGTNLSGGLCLQTMQWPDDAKDLDPVAFAQVILSQT